MEVTRKNFQEVLPSVSEAIQNADFLAIDTELTGLINGRDITIFDSPEEYYLAVSQGSSEFIIIQFGLCTFTWDSELEKYTNAAYNFYIFPRGKPGPETVFLCQSSSLDFLSAQGFDFNKLIKEGIPYMTEPTEYKLREQLKERQKAYSKEKDVIPIPDDCKEFIEQTCLTIRQFIDDNKEDEMDIDNCNAFLRRLMFQEAKARFKEEIYVETKILEDKSRILKVTRIQSNENLKDYENVRTNREWEEFEDAVGFSKVVRMISQSAKLVVGHNMLLDILHTLNHFVHPLPEEYESFKEFTHCVFPKLLDTKYMSSMPPFKDKVNSNVLSNLCSTLSQSPFRMPKTEATAECTGYNAFDGKHHEAGYDAFITGMCFLAMYQSIAGERCHDGDLEKIKPYINKLFLARTAFQDSPYINLTGEDAKPSRDHVFHMTFPKHWQRNDINQFFSPYGQITVQFLSDTTALVALSRRDQARTVGRVLARTRNVVLIPFREYKNGNKAKQVSSTKADKEVIEDLNNAEVDVAARQVTSTKVKVQRETSNSASSTPGHTTRKRTSSGVFEIEACDEEPPPKKTEVGKSDADHEAEPTKAANGRIVAEKEKNKKVVIPQKFDEEAVSTCVTAFKENESWE